MGVGVICVRNRIIGNEALANECFELVPDIRRS